ncbi:coproporphyrinogen III oxidase [Hylemonella gracilis str. Niagara R]|uniref:Coproporphyrinogen-III oxidase n=2 Tax=Hylemonella gracilis TaxID=80880 RepID=A0A016XHX6_9BURK|nr:coproporphyrinogen III oxidase [Hylemonella gracilis str. Niagara R]
MQIKMGNAPEAHSLAPTIRFSPMRKDTDSAIAPDAPLALTPELLRRHDVSGPRYTSYPTADRFVEAFGATDYAQALGQRGGAGAGALPLSLYVHIPFCESLCYYCACNKIITKHHERAAEYLRYLAREVDLHLEALGAGTAGHAPAISQLHLGGGTPTFLNDAELRALMRMLQRAFHFTPGGEYSIEVDPRTIDAGRLDVLAELGFNRLSFGVQDFDPAVQKAVHRVQPAEQVFALVQAARDRGFESVNTDLIYGLPLQTPESFARTLDQVCALRPERIALYAYAHLPERFKPQRRIDGAQLPGAAAKLAMLSDALARLQGAGYVYVGMDHFALPDDALAVAQRQGRLHRNFQGYSTQPDCDLIGLGVSAIGRIGATYSQNAKTLEEYYDALDRGCFPVQRGLALSRDDLVRRAVIMALMCQGELMFESINLAWLIDFKTYFATELEALRGLAEQGLVSLDLDARRGGIQVTPLGWYFVRAIAMVFDRYLQADRNRARFSKIL